MTERFAPLASSHASPTSYRTRKEAKLQPDMPGIIVFVHGVNSEGEWYEEAEQFLLAGLNRRLGRHDLVPRPWLPRKAAPDVAESASSPVMHFFWGYRSPNGAEQRWRVPLMDRHRESARAKNYTPHPPLYWGGGPFQNGCNSLPLLWSEQGFRRRVWAGFVPVDIQKMNPEVDRQLQDAPPRTYYAHAAGRLANLVRRIRSRYPADTITLIGHSQGTQIVLAAVALLDAAQQPDCIMLMNSPYALESKLTDEVTQGLRASTEAARSRTFENIVKRFRSGYRPLGDDLLQRLRVGVDDRGQRWTTTAANERDNTGRLYVYFNPHDRVMGATALQSIGWQGLPKNLLDAFPGTLYQRMLARTTPCGGRPGMEYLWPRSLTGERQPFWNRMKQTRGLIGMDLWATPDPEERVYINAEEVPEPLTAADMVGFDERIDTDSKKWSELESYPFYRDIYERERWVEEHNPYEHRPHRRLETQAEMEQRIGSYIPEPTDHSTLPSHELFLSRVVAYDLPIGFCESHKDIAFWAELNRLADWRQGDPYFHQGILQIPSMPALIDLETVEDLRRQQELTAALWRKSSRTGEQVA